jgi:hypothetical protein
VTQEELTERCAYWQQRLALQDWQVTVQLVRQRELDSQGASAEFDCVWPKRRVQINILDSIDFPTDCLFQQDQELDLVHELLHAYTVPLEEKIRFAADDETETPEWVLVEQAIHAISTALLALDREAKA